MDANDRQVIDELFDKVRQAEAQGGPRDAEAETLIRRHLETQPAAPYYMAQAIVVLESLLAQARDRQQELERELASRPAGGGFLAGLFGGGQPGPQPAARPAAVTGHQPAPGGGPWQQAQAAQQGQGGFMGGALGTAMAIGGGMLIGSMLAGGGAQAAEPGATDAGDPAAGDMMEDGAFDAGYDGGGDDGGFFDSMDF